MGFETAFGVEDIEMVTPPSWRLSCKHLAYTLSDTLRNTFAH